MIGKDAPDAATARPDQGARHPTLDADPGPTSTRMGGLDLLRVGAVVLVTIQHIFSLYGLDSWLRWRGLSFGQFGVSLFLGVSAVVCNSTQRPPVPWLIQRLRRIFPAYWIATAISFLLTWLAGYKSFTVAQVLSQMLGVGLYTHGNVLVNVSTWFVSLILFCYLILFLIRLVGYPLLGSLLVFAVLASCEERVKFLGPWSHLLTFFGASTLIRALPVARREAGFLIAGLLVLLAAGESQKLTLIYTGMTLALIGASTRLVKPPLVLKTIADFSYEYYLVHGICLVATRALLPAHPAVAVVLGVLLAVGMGVCLRLGVETITRGFR